MIANLNETISKKSKITKSEVLLTGFNKNMFVSDLPGLNCGICLDVNNPRLKSHKKKPNRCIQCGTSMPHSDWKHHKTICEESRIVMCSDCGIEMTNSDLRVHHGEYLCEMSPYRCPYESLFGLCVPSCTGSVNQATHRSHLGESETLITTIFEKYLELMNVVHTNGTRRT